jgi:membrane fusion protein (multidrug efflux system)
VWKVASVGFLEEWTEFAGTTLPLPDKIARISTSVDGKVRAVLPGSGDQRPAEGKKVEAGTVVVQLDTSVIEETLASAEKKQTSAQLAVKGAEVEVERLRKLLQDPVTAKAVPAVDRERADLALKDAQAKLDSAIKDVDALKAQMKLYTLTAPITGRLGRLLVVPGQALGVGAAVADVVDVDEQIDVICFVPPRVIGRLKVGQQAHTGGADKKPEEETPGEVIFIADQAEPDTGNFAVKVRFANADKRLRANSVVRLSLLMDGKECVSLPETAVQQDTEKPTVVVVTDIKEEENKEVVKQIDNLQKQQKEAAQRGDEKKAAELGREIEKLEKLRVTTKGVARRVKATLGLKSRHQHQIEIVDLIDDGEEEPDKPKPEFKLQDGQWYALEFEIKDGQRQLKRRDVAQFVTEGGEGVQSGDVVKFKVDED